MKQKIITVHYSHYNFKN